jgi:hypothetical protein
MIQIKSAALGKLLAFPSIVAALALGLLSTGCATMSYKPSVSLPESPRTIKATVNLVPMDDQSPASDKQKHGGYNVCDSSSLVGDLSTAVTDAILTDFNNNQVFETVKKRFDTNPDLIAKGTIHRFKGEFNMTALGWCTLPIDIVWLFGLPVMEADVNVELSMTFQRPDGTVLGTYHGASKSAKGFSIYENAVLSLPSFVNKALSECVAQIREQILNDESKLTPAPAAVPVK